MVMDTLPEKIERMKALGEIFLKEDLPIFVKDMTGDLFFGKLLLVSEDSFTMECTGPYQRNGQKVRLFWAMIVNFEEYIERGDSGRTN